MRSLCPELRFCCVCTCFQVLIAISVFSGFSTTTTSSGGTGGGMSMSGAAPSGGTGSSMSTGGNGAAPSGGGGDGTGGVSSGMTDSYNFLRGGWQTNENGIVTFKTIFPGFCESQMISSPFKNLIVLQIPDARSICIPWYIRTSLIIPTEPTPPEVDRSSML